MKNAKTEKSKTASFKAIINKMEAENQELRSIARDFEKRLCEAVAQRGEMQHKLHETLQNAKAGFQAKDVVITNLSISLAKLTPHVLVSARDMSLGGIVNVDFEKQTKLL